MGANRKCFRKRTRSESPENSGAEDEEELRSTMEEVKFLQKQRERRVRMVANQLAQPLGQAPKVADKGEGEGEKEELVLQDTFAQETAVTVEDPNM
jgi:hypothetical protein